MTLLFALDRFFARAFIRGSKGRIRQVGNTQKEQTYYYHFS